MYAIVKTGGKQYKVEKDMRVKVEKLDAKVGDKINLDCILVVDSKNNLTLAKDSDKMTVEAKVVAQEKQPKVVVFHYKAKKQIRKKQGHRQPYTEIQITNIAV
jgi:ribosomal protein L21